MKRPLVFAAGGFVLGEVWLLLPVGFKAVVFALVLCGICCVWETRRRKREVRESGGGLLLFWLLPFLLSFSIGAGLLWADGQKVRRYELAAEAAGAEPTAAKKASADRGDVYLTGKAADIRPGNGTSYERLLQVDHVNLLIGGKQVTYGSVLVYEEKISENVQVRAGSTILVKGKLERMGKATNPGQFDYENYYHSLGIEGRMYVEEVQVMGDGYSPLMEAARKVKGKAGEILEAICDPRDRGLFQAVILGDKTSLDDDVYDLYRKNGIAHLLAVSGLHVSLIGMGFYRILRRMGVGLKWAGIPAAALTAFYGILTGSSVSAVRAVLMICLQLGADRLGRTYDMLSAAAAAAILLLLQSPSLLFQAGFQLSFGAVIAIGAVLPLLNGRPFISAEDIPASASGESFKSVSAGVQSPTEIKPPADGRREGRKYVSAADPHAAARMPAGFLNAGAAIQAVTFPIIVWNFFEFPIYGFLLNFLVIPLISYVVISGIGGILLGLVWLPAGRFAAGSGHYILAFYERLCLAAEKLPGAVQIMGRPRLWQIFVYVLMWLGLLIVWRGLSSGRLRSLTACRELSSGRLRPPDVLMRFTAALRPHADVRNRLSGLSRYFPDISLHLILAAGFLGGFFLLRPLPVKGLEVTFLDVGQGDGICLETRDMVVLVDGGSSSDKKLGEQVLEPFLKSRGIGKVDYAMISHGDEDHVSGIRSLLESDCGISVDTLVLPWLGRGNEKYEELIRLAERAGTKTVWMKAGGQIRGSLNLLCLYAGDQNYKDDINDHSLIIEASYGEMGLLLTGDISEEGEKRWIELARSQGDGAQGGSSSTMALPPTGDIQILKAAHHGSNYSTSREFLEYVNPRWAVISCGAGNRYGHPGEAAMGRLEEKNIKCFLTMEEGAVIMTTDGKKIRAETYEHGLRVNGS